MSDFLDNRSSDQLHFQSMGVLLKTQGVECELFRSTGHIY